MAKTEDPTYFQVRVLGSSYWMQSIPVGWHIRQKIPDGSKGKRVQVLAITVEAIAGWIQVMQKAKVSKTLYPLIQAKNEAYNRERVTKKGKPLSSSLVFMDLDGDVSEGALKLFQEAFDQYQIGHTFRTFTEGRAKVVFVVNGTPTHNELAEFIQKMYFKNIVFQAHDQQIGIPRPDCSFSALTNAFIPTEAVLWGLTKALPCLRVHDVQAYNHSTQIEGDEEIKIWHMVTGTPIPNEYATPVLPCLKPEPIQEPICYGDEDDEDNVKSDASNEDSNNILFPPYITPVDPAYLKANWGADVEQPGSRLDAVKLGKGWFRGWCDYEGPIPEWMMDPACIGDQAIKPGSVDGKFLRWLLGSAKALCGDGLDIPQLEVAKYLGVTQPAVWKSITRFVERGWLTKVPHLFRIEKNTDLDALGKIDGLAWNPVIGEGGEIKILELHGHWTYKRSLLITGAMGYSVGPKAIQYKTFDLGIQFACLEALRWEGQGREKTIEVVEELLGRPEDLEITAGTWQESLWQLMKTGHFQDQEVWYDYCLRIPGILDAANSPRIGKLNTMWAWVEEHWDSVSKDR